MIFNKVSMRTVGRELLPIFLMIWFSFLILNNAVFTPVKLWGDDYFHLSRLYNLSMNPFQFLYPQNFMTGSQIGVATNVFYPAINVQLISILIPKFVGTINMFRLFLFLVLLLLQLSLYLLLRFSELQVSKWKALVISMLWAGIVISYEINTIGGETLSKISFPFVAYGLMQLQKEKGL